MTCLDRWQHLPRICLALAPLFACLFAVEVQGLVLAQGGKTDYHIYVGASAPPAERRAAEGLAAFLKQATGATFPIVHTREQTTGPLLVVGVNELTKKTLRARPESGLLGDDGFEIRRRGDHLFVFGGSPRGTLYGVYFFLDKYLGYRWYSSGFSVIPTVKSVRLGKIDERQVPRFSYREVFSRDADDPVFSARNRLNGQFGHRLARFLKDAHGGSVSIRGINIFGLVEPAKYHQGHPEYFGGGQELSILAGITAYREGGKEASTDALVQAIEIPRTMVKPPTECDGRRQDECIEIQDLGFNLAGDARVVAHRIASDGAAARMGGGSTVWGIQLPLWYWLPPEGNCRILLSVRVDPGTGAATDPALRMGVYLGDRREVHVAEAATAYKLFELPGTWRQETARSMWVAPPGRCDRGPVRRSDHRHPTVRGSTRVIGLWVQPSPTP